MPLPVGQIAVFTAITVPYLILLTVLGLPFNHNLFWLYVLPPGVLTWLATRPVLESKRLPELISSQLRYLGEPPAWCRMAPLAEKDEVAVYGRVWRRGHPALVVEAAEATEIAAVADAGQIADTGQVADTGQKALPRGARQASRGRGTARQGSQRQRGQRQGARQQGSQQPGAQRAVAPGRAPQRSALPQSGLAQRG